MIRLPPQQIEKNLSDLIDLVPDLCEDLLSSVDQPLKIARDKQVAKVFTVVNVYSSGFIAVEILSNAPFPPLIAN